MRPRPCRDRGTFSQVRLSSLRGQWCFCLWAALHPQLLGHSQRIDFAILPPPPFITSRVIFAVVNGAERHGELVAHLQGQAARLRIPNMMGMRWGTPTDDAGLLGDKAEVLFRANSFGLAQGEDALVDFRSWLGARRVARRWLDILFGQGDGATFEVRNEILCNDATWGGAVGLFVDSADGVDIALPNGKELLDVRRLSEGFAERGNELVDPIETLAGAAGEA